MRLFEPYSPSVAGSAAALYCSAPTVDTGTKVIHPTPEESKARAQLIKELSGGKFEVEVFLSGNVPAVVPPSFDLSSFRAAAALSGPFEFYSRFKMGGDYDFKKNGHPEYAQFGNWAAGLYAHETGWLGLEVLQRGAGGYQELVQTKAYLSTYGHWYNFGSELTGDAPEDTREIEKGWRAAERAEPPPVLEIDFDMRVQEPDADWSQDSGGEPPLPDTP